MSFGEHVRGTLRAAATTSLALGLLLTVIGLLTSGIQINVEFDQSDAPWLLLVVPATGLIIATLMFPLSYLIDRLLFRRRR